MRHGGIAIVLALGSVPALPKEPDDLEQAGYARLVYHRAKEDDRGRCIGQTSVRELRHPENGSAVVLLSLAHIGNKEYYQSLTPHLRDAGVILAEGTGGLLGKRARDEELPPDGLWIRRYHAAAARLLDLAQQHDWEASVIDNRWTLADMGPAEIKSAMAEAGSVVPDELRLLVERWEAALRGTSSPEDLDRARADAARSVMANFHGVGSSETLARVHRAREEIAWRTVRKHLEGAGARRVAVVYGALHVRALEERLLRDLGFRLEGVCWIDAIVCEAPAPQGEKR